MIVCSKGRGLDRRGTRNLSRESARVWECSELHLATDDTPPMPMATCKLSSLAASGSGRSSVAIDGQTILVRLSSRRVNLKDLASPKKDTELLTSLLLLWLRSVFVDRRSRPSQISCSSLRSCRRMRRFSVLGSAQMTGH